MSDLAAKEITKEEEMKEERKQVVESAEDSNPSEEVKGTPQLTESDTTKPNTDVPIHWDFPIYIQSLYIVYIYSTKGRDKGNIRII